MKKFMLGTAIALLLATPALAQSYDPNMGTGNIAPPFWYQPEGAGAFAMEPTPVPSAHLPQFREVNPYSPGGCGAGSIGYNEQLEQSCR